MHDEGSVKRGEAIISLKPCGFYGGYGDTEKEGGHCNLENCQTRCNGDFKLCENLKTLKKYLLETGLGWQGRGRRNGTD